jgi:hypothetical protein
MQGFSDRPLAAVSAIPYKNTALETPKNAPNFFAVPLLTPRLPARICDNVLCATTPARSSCTCVTSNIFSATLNP